MTLTVERTHSTYSPRSAAAGIAVPVLSSNFAQLLWDSAVKRPDQPVIVERDSETSYAELRIRAGRVAGALSAGGIKPGDRVGIFLERGADAAAAFFGAVACGAVAININETLRPRQIEHILSHSGAAALISSKSMLSRQPREITTPLIKRDIADIVNSGDDVFTPVPRVGTDLVQIIYTSGSTGLPKGVVLTHSNLWSGVRAVTSYVRINENDRIASLLPFSFDYGFNQLLCAVGTGACLIVERSPLPQQIVESLRAHNVTVLPCVPPLWLQLLGSAAFRETPLPNLRAMTNTGGRVPVDAVRQLRAANPQAELFLMYGLT